ncbi:uncharacterized protein LOC113755585 [Coffea eugenioides]|uniref:uncharacterized protein LOC113755585 n=1 Tax=Coffea eugenioides TaxID=49369 RepID=UPI000F60A4FE|nr:uncharacterized protein LOC113755585 [Coffea eugenioides]
MDCIGEEVFKKRRRLCIALAREIDNKNEKLLEMERTMKEKDILLKEALEAKQSFKLELEKLKSRMEFQKKELEQQGKEEFNHWQATVVAQGRKQENSDMGCVVESQKMNLEQAINEIEKFDSKTDLNGQHTMGNKDEVATSTVLSDTKQFFMSCCENPNESKAHNAVDYRRLKV